ncbi:MAG: hypothetical protein KF778_14950 [Rhodocyclaceae bacterium]|nr:hypothetical protein [Rhodocyclaceae bacterium]
MLLLPASAVVAPPTVMVLPVALADVANRCWSHQIAASADAAQHQPRLRHPTTVMLLLPWALNGPTKLRVGLSM